MRSRVLLLFVLTPLIEMVLLIRLGQWMGFWPTVMLVLATGLAGGLLARHQGLATWRRFQSSFSEGRLPTDEILDGVIILVAAALLLTPGVLTDIIGFLGLVPAARSGIRKLMTRRAMVSGGISGPFGRAAAERMQADRKGSDGYDGEGWRGEAAQRPQHERTAGTGDRSRKT